MRSKKLTDVRYIGLSLANPLDDASGLKEPNGGDYARVLVTESDWDILFTDDEEAIANNVNEITFPEASSGWGVVTYFAIFDAATGGNMLAYGPLVVSKKVRSGDAVSFAVNAFTIKE